MKVFIYGSLKIGFHNNYILHQVGAIKRHDVVTREPDFELISLGSFPGLLHKYPGYLIFGELWDVDDEGITVLDRLEGHPNFYKRETISLLDINDKVITYFINPDDASEKPVETLSSEGAKIWIL